jgi:sucrose-6-phosphate hydrolase SacC (GH32 family)
MNDPNGLVFVDGRWHLCYQHHPHDLSWGPMHWGHATSTDLVTWHHEPVALRPDHLGTAFSGSAVVDHDGVSGFGAGAILAFFTHYEEGVPQSQGVAVSTDGGSSWHPHDGNPVLRAPEGVVDFRDPKVFRYGGTGPDGRWVMVLAAGHEVALFSSVDLLRWEPLSTFGRGHGAHDGVWETPDLLELEVEGTGERRWVLLVSVLGGGPAGGSGSQWFLGTFDGTSFLADDAPEVVRWVDLGGDFYAPQSWSGAPGERRVVVAWMSNWAYGRTTPADTWRGMMTVPRELTLRDEPGGVVLRQWPVPELDHHGRTVVELDGVRLSEGWRADVGEVFDLQLVVASGSSFAIVLLDGAVRVSWRDGVMVLARSVEGMVGADPSPQEALVGERDGQLDLRLVVDTCSVELFAATGTVTLTNQVFPRSPVAEPLVLLPQDGDMHVRRLVLRDLTGTG